MKTKKRKEEKEIKESLAEGKREKHRELVKTGQDIKEAEKHLQKAEHYLKVTEYLVEGNFSDISLGTLFYTMYQCFLSIASKFGYESRNQSCTISLIEYLKEQGKINIDKRFLKYFEYEERDSEDTGESIIDSSGEKGIPIGNLTSQLFANVYLNELDYFVKHELNCRFYLRYMDDFIILGDKKGLGKIKERIILFLSSLRLQIHNKKARIFPAGLGIDFLGYVIFKDYMKARKKTVKRALKKIRNKIGHYNTGKIDFEKLQESLNSWNAYLKHGNTYGLRNKLKEEFKNVM